MNDLPLPSGWKMTRIGDLGKVVTGKTPPTINGDCWGGSIPFVTPSDLNESDINSTSRTITDEGLKFCKVLPKGTVFVSCIGYVGKTAILAAGRAVSNQQINAIIPNASVAIGRYVQYVVGYMEPKLKEAASITTVPILNKSNFEGFCVPLPPLPEQRAIAAALRAVQDSREARRRELALERERKAALMEELFTRGTRGEACKETEIGRMPQSWEVIPFEQVIAFIQYGISQRGELAGQYPILRMNCLLEGKVRLTNLQYVELDDKTFQSFRLQRGDLLFNRTNSQDLVGKTGLFDENLACIFASYLIRVRVCIDKADAAFMNYYLNYAPTLTRLRAMASRGVSQSNINASKLKGLIIPYPQLKEQQEIAEVLTACDQKIAALEAESALHDELFRALLEELMTGRLPTTDLIESEEQDVTSTGA